VAGGAWIHCIVSKGLFRNKRVNVMYGEIRLRQNAVIFTVHNSRLAHRL
jgi:hypothetical protein